ncbi:ATP-binding protein [Vitiosangium sp. GDMCC 1.1324]|uniref:ATP-binding protein n=1 Tax=Vitiosangium sp. (strain GDMCC 1.1324) TaxID=2138576 RepID=UPI00130EF1EF|nr:ATP-binding protein [Vitiosangium sp. GDMCC 1.1324]
MDLRSAWGEEPGVGAAPGGGAERKLLSGPPLLIARFDRRLRHLYVSPEVERVTGLPAALFLGRTNEELGMPPRLIRDWNEQLHRTFQREEGQMLEFRCPSLDEAGGQVPSLFVSRLVPEFDEAGNVCSVWGFTQRFERSRCRLSPGRITGQARSAEPPPREEPPPSPGRGGSGGPGAGCSSRNELLGRLSRALAACNGQCDVFHCLGRLVMPSLGDWCDLDVLRDGVLQRAAAFRAPHGGLQGPPGGPPSLLARRVARTGRAELLRGPGAQVTRALSSGDGDQPCLQEAGLLDCMAVPLLLGGQLVGVLSFATREPELRLGEDRLELAEDLAGCVALVLETLRLRQELERTRQAELCVDTLERELQRQAADFRTLLDVIPVGIGIAHERECRRIRQNPWFARLQGLPLESNISLSAPDGERQPIRYLDGHGRVVPPEEMPMQRAAATGQEVLDVELELEVDGLRRGTVVISAVPLLDEAQCPRGAIGTFQDVTARKRAMEAQRFLAESSAVLSSSLDQEQTSRTLVRLCVPALATVASFCGWRSDGTFGALSVTHADPSRQLLATEAVRRFVLSERHPIREAMATGLPRLIPVLQDVASWCESQDEVLRGLRQRLATRSVMLIPLATAHGVAGVLVLGSSERSYTEDDFTFAKEYAAHAAYAIDNARLYREAQEAIAVRDEFLGIAGHELRTPLTALQLGLQSLARQSVAPGEDAGLSKWVARCQDQGVRLGRLVGDLLDVSRITSGRLPMDPEEMDLSALVEEVAARMGPELEKAGCALVLKLEPALTGCWDRLRLDQVLTNLLSNAMKYGQGLPIEVSAEASAEGVRLRVRDEGIGISSEDQARIFERFERAVPDRHYGGLGLGLWISRQIVLWLGGHIRVESEQGRGSNFTVELPRWVEG